MQRRVSVIIPVYNAEKYLPNCLESIINQTYNNWEVILIDDGSSDKSGKICDKYAENHENIIAFHKENGGVSSARNLGLQKSTGDYICFVDGDDWIGGCMLEYLVRAIEEDESDMAMCQIKLVDHYCQEHGDSYELMQKYTQDSKHYLVDNFLNNGNSCCAKIFKRSTIIGLEFQQGLTIGEDMLFLLQAQRSFEKISVLDFEGYYYLQIPSSAMNKSFRLTYMDEIACWEKALQLAREYGLEVQNRIKAHVIMSACLVLNKLAVIDKKSRPARCCKEAKAAVARNAAGFKYLGIKHKAHCLLVLLNVNVYMYLYRCKKRKSK